MDWIIEHWQEVLFWAGIADIIAGALPNSWVKWQGIIFKITGALREFDVGAKAKAAKKKTSTSLGAIVFALFMFVFWGCFASFEIDPGSGLVKYKRIGGQEIAGLTVDKKGDEISVLIEGLKSSAGTENIKAATELLKAIPVP